MDILTLTKRSLLLLLLLIGIPMAAQTFHHADNGYFVKNGTSWEEYRPQDKQGVWATYLEYGTSPLYYYIRNKTCEIAVPKNPTVNDFLIDLHDGNGLRLCYRHLNSQPLAANNSGYFNGLEPATSRVPCVSCGGSKICMVCGGSLYVTYQGFLKEYTLACPNCSQTGICQGCHGTGYTIIDNGVLGGIGGSSVGNSHSGNSSSSSSAWCRKCHGHKVCSTCSGKGVYFTRMYGADKWITCPECNGSKVCSLCGGR